MACKEREDTLKLPKLIEYERTGLKMHRLSPINQQKFGDFNFVELRNLIV